MNESPATIAAGPLARVFSMCRLRRRCASYQSPPAAGRLTAALVALLLVTAPLGVRAEDTIHPIHLTDADLEEVRQLLDEGANVNATHIGGGTALHHLVRVSAQMGMDGLMIRNKKIIRPGQWDATGHEAVAVLLTERGASIDALDGNRMTPLHVAALTGHAAAARFLLERGANINARDSEGHTPLYWARWSATDSAIAELAAATGARINPNGVKRRAAAVIAVLEKAGATD